MNMCPPQLTVIRLPGLHLDTLGHYFAALGLLRLAARQWRTVKGCWRDGVFCLVGGPANFSELETFLLDVGANNKWTPYVQEWKSTNKNASAIINKSASKKESAKKNAAYEAGRILLLWRNEIDERIVPLFSAHIVGGSRRDINPVFKDYGGKRNYPDGWRHAATEITNSPDKVREGLLSFLNGVFGGESKSGYNAGSWFSDANKKYNFAPNASFSEGRITPWAMLLACESFPLFAGAVARQLGSQREGTGTFPFVTKGIAPENEKESGNVECDFWSPVFEKPQSISEVVSLFSRGRAEIGKNGARTSAAFSVAIMRKGTDVGISEFRRFSLFHTTSTKTVESRLASVHPITIGDDVVQASAVSHIIRFRDALPREYKKGKKWIYRGLQGPIDNALVRLAAVGASVESRNEKSWELLDSVFRSLEKTANNKTYREREPQLELLPLSWLISLLENKHEDSPELRIALAFSSLRAHGEHLAPLLAYRVGVIPAWRDRWQKIKIAKNAPLRVSWSERTLEDNLSAVASRRLVEAEKGDKQPVTSPFEAQLTLALDDVFTFLKGETNDMQLVRWLNRFTLFDWAFVSEKERAEFHKHLHSEAAYSRENSAIETLYAFFRPLFSEYTFRKLQGNTGKKITDTDEVATTKMTKLNAGALRPIVALLERGDATGAFVASTNCYKSLLQTMADFGEMSLELSHSESHRLLAALLLPAAPTSVAKTFSRWTLPARNKQPS